MYMPTICTLAPKRGLNGQGRRQQSRIALGLSFLDRIDDSHGYGCTLHDFVDLLPPRFEIVLRSGTAKCRLHAAANSNPTRESSTTPHRKWVRGCRWWMVMM